MKAKAYPRGRDKATPFVREGLQWVARPSPRRFDYGVMFDHRGYRAFFRYPDSDGWNSIGSKTCRRIAIGSPDTELARIMDSLAGQCEILNADWEAKGRPVNHDQRADNPLTQTAGRA